MKYESCISVLMGTLKREHYNFCTFECQGMCIFHSLLDPSFRNKSIAQIWGRVQFGGGTEGGYSSEDETGSRMLKVAETFLQSSFVVKANKTLILQFDMALLKRPGFASCLLLNSRHIMKMQSWSECRDTVVLQGAFPALLKQKC